MDSLHEINKQKQEIKNQPFEINREEEKVIPVIGNKAGEAVIKPLNDQPAADEHVRKEKEETLERVMFEEYAYEQIEKNEARKVIDAPDLKQMRQSHDVVMEYRLKKRNIIKPNEYELVPKVDNKELKLQDKMRNMLRVTRDVDTYTERMINSRKRVPIELKKHFDYHTFSSLNDITDCMGEKEGQLATHIMKIDYLSLDMSNDDMLAKNCFKLEEMSKAVQGFSKMLRDNPDYLDHLLEKNVKESNESIGASDEKDGSAYGHVGLLSHTARSH